MLRASPLLIQVSPQRNPGQIKAKALFYTPKYKYAKDHTSPSTNRDTAGTLIPEKGSQGAEGIVPYLKG